MRLRPATLALLALTTAAQPCSAEQLPQITLKGGEGQTIPDTGVTLLLTGITDQRCPAGVDCYWEGMIRAEITVLGPKPELMEIILCNLCDDGSRDAKVAGVSLTLIRLAPSTEDLAKLGREPRLTDYALTVNYRPAN